ncbi:hypothetical protein NBRGN_065_00330 [Nocardia brasiliensis NBRC 14402]|nr:hypothetical protein NBRGN_065_00330 [Nocardia brasiliensis NBRC 14402]
MTILSTPDIAAAGQAMRWLVTSARDSGLAVSATNIGWGSRTSPTLTAVQLAALAPLLDLSDQLRYRTGAAMPQRPPKRSARVDRLVHRIPATLWPAWSLRFAIPQCHRRTLQSCLSAAILLVGTRLRLPEAAEYFGGQIDGPTLSRVLQLLANHAEWIDIRAALTRISDHLADIEVPIDYQRRRKIDYTDLLPDHIWAAACRDTGTPGPTAARALIARCFLFGQLSGLPADTAPSAPSTNAFRTKTADFARTLTPELRAALHEHAAEFLAHPRIRREPVIWHPSTSVLNGLRLPGPDPDAVDITRLHQLIRQEDLSLGKAAAAIGTTLDTVRYLLETNPAPAQQPATADEARARGRASLAARLALTPEQFADLYQRQRISLRDIAARVGVSRQVLAGLARDYQIPLREPRQFAKIQIDRDWLYDQYVNQRRTLPELADETGMSIANMARWAKHHNIPTRPRGGPSHSASLRASREAAAAPINLQPALAGIGGWERLRRFAAAVDYPTLTVAGQTLGINPFTLINQINRLEQDLGGPLLNRAERNRPMTTTSLGDEVLAAIEVAARDHR